MINLSAAREHYTQKELVAFPRHKRSRSLTRLKICCASAFFAQLSGICRYVATQRTVGPRATIPRYGKTSARVMSEKAELWHNLVELSGIRGDDYYIWSACQAEVQGLFNSCDLKIAPGLRDVQLYCIQLSRRANDWSASPLGWHGEGSLSETLVRFYFYRALTTQIVLKQLRAISARQYKKFPSQMRTES